MNDITAILHQLEEGRLSTEEAAEKIRAATAPASSHTDIDYGRLERTGCPEVIYGAGKTPDQIEEIARGLLAAGPPCWWLWQAWKERFPACWPGW